MTTITLTITPALAAAIACAAQAKAVYDAASASTNDQYTMDKPAISARRDALWDMGIHGKAFDADPLYVAATAAYHAKMNAQEVAFGAMRQPNLDLIEAVRVALRGVTIPGGAFTVAAKGKKTVIRWNGEVERTTAKPITCYVAGLIVQVARVVGDKLEVVWQAAGEFSSDPRRLQGEVLKRGGRVDHQYKDRPLTILVRYNVCAVTPA